MVGYSILTLLQQEPHQQRPLIPQLPFLNLLQDRVEVLSTHKVQHHLQQLYQEQLYQTRHPS